MNVHTGTPQIAAAKLQHHVIYVSDLKRSKDFYDEALRFAVFRTQPSRLERGHAVVQSGNAFFQLRLLSPRSLSGEASQAEDGQQFHAALYAGGARHGRHSTASAPARRRWAFRCATAASSPPRKLCPASVPFACRIPTSIGSRSSRSNANDRRRLTFRPTCCRRCCRNLRRF